MKHLQTYDVAIVGGGLVGLCIAFHLARSQRSVVVIDGTHAGRASRAAAGMLAPTCEWQPEASRAFLTFLRYGRAYYREFLSQLLEHSQFETEVGYSEKQYLLLDLLENERDLSNRFEALQATGADVRWLNRREAWELEPLMNPEAIRGAILISGDAIVNPRLLHRVLRTRLLQQQVTILEANLLGVEERQDDFLLSMGHDAVLACTHVVIAAGAWSYEVADKFHLEVPVSLAKGQIVQLTGTPGILQHVLYMPAGACGCLLERSPGVYITGTSEEYVSAQATNTSEVIAAILTRINTVFPPARAFVIDDMWSGFRPITPDELPIIGRTSHPRILVATGHYRNGILLSPLTGQIVQSLLEGYEPPVDIEAYRYERPFHMQYRYASAY